MHSPNKFPVLMWWGTYTWNRFNLILKQVWNILYHAAYLERKAMWFGKLRGFRNLLGYCPKVYHFVSLINTIIVSFVLVVCIRQLRKKRSNLLSLFYIQVPKSTFTTPREERLIEEAKERNRRRAEVSKVFKIERGIKFGNHNCIYLYRQGFCFGFAYCLCWF